MEQTAPYGESEPWNHPEERVSVCRSIVKSTTQRAWPIRSEAYPTMHIAPYGRTGFFGASEQCWALLEYLVCQCEETRRNRESQGSSRLEVNGQRVFRRLLDRHVSGLRAVQNLVHKVRDMAELLACVSRVRQESPHFD